VSRHLIIRPLAEADLLSAQQWYNDQHAGLGDELRRTIDRLVSRILETPRLYPEVYRHVRRAVVRRRDAVIVLACLHSKQDQARLRSRVR